MWPEGLAHYVAVHDVRLPEEFIEHSRSMRFTIPIDLEDKTSRCREYDLDFWTDGVIGRHRRHGVMLRTTDCRRSYTPRARLCDLHSDRVAEWTVLVD